jgi:hypothetical protein
MSASRMAASLGARSDLNGEAACIRCIRIGTPGKAIGFSNLRKYFSVHLKPFHPAASINADHSLQKEIDMSEFRHVMPFLIPLVAIIMGIGIGMLALWLDHQKKIHLLELHHKERVMAIERGMEVPPLPAEFFQGRAKSETSLVSNLRWGLIWLLLGLAVATALILNGDSSSAAWSLVPIAIGLAQLIFYSIGHAQQRGIDLAQAEPIPKVPTGA